MKDIYFHDSFSSESLSVFDYFIGEGKTIDDIYRGNVVVMTKNKNAIDKVAYLLMYHHVGKKEPSKAIVVIEGDIWYVTGYSGTDKVEFFKKSITPEPTEVQLID